MAGVTASNPPPGAPSPVVRAVAADDSPESRALLRAVIAGWSGLELVGEAADGQAAVALVEQFEPDLVLLDIAMPVMDGLEAAEQIRRRAPDAKIVMLSAYGAERMEQSAREAGADVYVEKGEITDTLRTVVTRLFPTVDVRSRPRVQRAVAGADRPDEEVSQRRRYHALLDALDEAVLVLDGSASVLAANFAAARTLGIPTSRLTGCDLADCGFDPTPGSGTSLVDLVRSGRPASHVAIRQHHGERSRYLLASVRPLAPGGLTPEGETLVSLVDVTDLESARDRYRALADNLPGMAALVFDRDLRFTTAAGSGVAETVGDADRVVGRSVLELGLADRGRVMAQRMTATLAGVPQTFDTPGLHDATIWSHQYVPLRSKDGKIESGMLVARDVTEQRSAEAVIAEREERFRTALDLMLDPALILRSVRDGDGSGDFRIVFANRAAHDVITRYGVSTADLLWSALPTALRRDEDQANFRRVVRTGQAHATYALMPEPLDSGWGRRGYDMRVARIGDGVLVTYQDVAGRRAASEGERRIDRLRSVVSAAGQAALHAEDEAALIRDACRIAVEHGGFLLAWVGLVDGAGVVRPVAAAGDHQDYLRGLSIAVHGGARSRGPTGTAVRTGGHVAMNDIEQDPSMAPWRAAALERGFGSSGAFPLYRGRDCVGALTVYAGDRAYFSDTEIVMLDQLVADISHGMTTLAGQRSVERSEETLRTALDTLDEAFAILAPVRDAAGAVVDFRWQYANTPARNAVTVTGADLIGASVQRRGRPASWPRDLLPHCARAVESGGPLAPENVHYEHPDRSTGRIHSHTLRVHRAGESLAIAWRACPSDGEPEPA